MTDVPERSGVNTDPRVEASQYLQTFIHHPALGRLASHYGVELEPDTQGRLIQLRLLSEDWDFRRGLERDSLPSREVGDQDRDLVLAVAEGLGMRDGSPPRGREFDFVLVLGGLLRACATRPMAAAELVANGLAASNVVGLAGDRELSPREYDLATALPDEFSAATTEATALEIGLIRAFLDLQPSPPIRGSDEEYRWRVTEFLRGGTPSVSLLDAAKAIGDGSRVNTADTLKVFARHYLRSANRPVRVLLITSPIYVLYQHLVAARVLSLDCPVLLETVGSREAETMESHDGTYDWYHYLQEIRSAIMAADELHRLL